VRNDRNIMRQGTRQVEIGEYTQEEWPSGFTDRLMLVAIWFLGTWGFLYRSLSRLFGSLGAANLTAACTSRQKCPPHLSLALDKAAGSLNLAVTNRSRIDIWAEEARVDLLDIETDGGRYSPVQTVLKICLLIAPSDALHISLLSTVYNGAGRPQGAYSCAISTVLRCRTDAVDGVEFCQCVPLYRASMIALVPLSLRRMGRFDKPPGSEGAEVILSFDRDVQSRCVRRSPRVAAQSAVVVEGRFSDGSAFSNSTQALVLSAHGCLVALPKPVKIGESVVVRNVSTLREQRCQVVYVRGTDGSEIQAGLGFEAEAPEFWGTDCLPSIGVPSCDPS